MAGSIVGSISRYQWDIAVTRIGQLASEMRLSTGGQTVGGSNGNADDLTNWDGTKNEVLACKSSPLIAMSWNLSQTSNVQGWFVKSQ